MKVLITGKNSFIGNSVRAWLENREVGYTIDTISLKDKSLDEFSFRSYDAIFHVAGIAHIMHKKSFVSQYFTVNRDLAISVAKKAKDEGVKQFIFTSTMAIYGDDLKIGDYRPVDINYPNPTNAYGQSKLEADLAIQKLDSPLFKVVILRIPMVYGKAAKGNFLKLFLLSKKNPIYPKIKNIRSVLNINNLSELIRIIIQQSLSGIYYPQDKEYFSTSVFIKKVRVHSKKKTIQLSILNPFVKILSIPFKFINKIYGNKYYDLSYSTYKTINYQVSTLDEMIRDLFSSINS
jgi:UDP-glucose 4-epimerase